MSHFPFGTAVDPRDVTSDVQADQVRVEVWEGVAPGHGGICTTQAAPIGQLGAILAWQQNNHRLQVNVGVTVRLNAEVALVKIAQYSATDPKERGGLSGVVQVTGVVSATRPPRLTDPAPD